MNLQNNNEIKIPKQLILNSRLLPKRPKQKTTIKLQGKQKMKPKRKVSTNQSERKGKETKNTSANDSYIDDQINKELENIQIIYQQLEKETFKHWSDNNFL